MKYRLKAAWLALLGRPVAYGMTLWVRGDPEDWPDGTFLSTTLDWGEEPIPDSVSRAATRGE